jgi:hypothetical protein
LDVFDGVSSWMLGNGLSVVSWLRYLQDGADAVCVAGIVACGGGGDESLGKEDTEVNHCGSIHKQYNHKMMLNQNVQSKAI